VGPQLLEGWIIMQKVGAGVPKSIEIAAVIAIAALVLFYRVHVPPILLWDEARVAVNSLEMMTASNPLIVTFNSQADLWNTKPPLAIWLNALSMRAFGMNELALRLPALVAAVATVVAVYLFIRRISKSRATALLAALILLGTGGYVEVHVARTADFDSLLVLFVTLATFRLFFALERADAARKDFYVAAAFFVGGIFTKGVAGVLMLPGYALYPVWLGKFRDVASNRAVWLSGTLVLVSVALFLAARELSLPGYAEAMWGQDVGRFQTTLDGHFSEWPAYLSGLFWPWQVGLLTPLTQTTYGQSAFPWICFVPFAALPLSAFPSGSLISRASAYLFCCMLAFLIMVSMAATKLTWYVAPVYPIIAALSALGFHQLRTILRWPLVVPVGLVLAVACIGLNVWKITRDVSNHNLSAEQWLPSFLRSLDLAPSAKLRVVGERNWQTPAVKSGGVAGTEPYYGPLEFYVRSMRRRGQDVRMVGPGYLPKRGEVIIGCGEAVRAEFPGLHPLTNQGKCFALTG
jgi:4-amino-4-deoxy-L-arabinose transferase-like glycosyltransferase